MTRREWLNNSKKPFTKTSDSEATRPRIVTPTMIATASGNGGTSISSDGDSVYINEPDTRKLREFLDQTFPKGEDNE